MKKRTGIGSDYPPDGVIAAEPVSDFFFQNTVALLLRIKFAEVIYDHEIRTLHDYETRRVQLQEETRFKIHDTRSNLSFSAAM